MKVFVQAAARLLEAVARMYAEKLNFLALFVLIFAFFLFTLARFDLLPEAPVLNTVVPVALVALAPTVTSAAVELPMKIEIPTIGLSATVANSDTTDATALDALLLKGAVRYPTSAKLGETGNVVLFGHSSYLPVVGNPAYKTFDGIQKLHAGDLITVYSADAVYTYAVRSVTKESADSAGIPLVVAGRELTLVTCNSFATKTDRFVVVANFVESHASRF